MNRVTVFAALVSVVISAQGASIPFDLSPSPTNAVVGMTGSNETPPNTSPATGGELGTGIVFDDSTLQLTLHVGYGNAVGFTDLSSALVADHIHTAPVGQPGPVIIDLAPFTTALTPQSGIINGTVTLTPTQVADLFAGRDYINIHSVNFPDGEIRGQLIPVPEPEHVTFMALVGFLFLGALQTFRKRS